ncbi:MAG: phosphatidylglycerol lysyltransferase domain-containing protein, partial [Candidatus Omnitrophota bacterium]
MKLNNLSLKDKEIFNKYLVLDEHDLSVYAFANIYIWKGLFDIRWKIIEDSLCVFFSDRAGTFLYLEPLAKKMKPEVVGEVFKILDKFNTNIEISRIENAEEGNLDAYLRFGLEVKEKSCDYLCLRDSLAGLKGNELKSKRASYNYFIKHYKFEYTKYLGQDKDDCLKLYNLWAKQRKDSIKEDYYRFMLEDSLKSLSILLDNYDDLDCMGRLVRIDGKLKAFSFGFKLNKSSFCILYEITDLSMKGLAQFIFREFCRELPDYKYINIMDDSGLENLKQVKLSYHPVKLEPAYIVKRK